MIVEPGATVTEGGRIGFRWTRWRSPCAESSVMNCIVNMMKIPNQQRYCGFRHAEVMPGFRKSGVAADGPVGMLFNSVSAHSRVPMSAQSPLAQPPSSPH